MKGGLDILELLHLESEHDAAHDRKADESQHEGEEEVDQVHHCALQCVVDDHQALLNGNQCFNGAHELEE